MKMTVVTDNQGNILGAVQGHSLTEKQGDIEATVSFAPGHQTHQIEVDDDMGSVDDADIFQQRLHQHLQQHHARQGQP